MPGVRLPLKLPAPPAPDEAAAIVVAIERFMRATTSPRPAVETGPDRWQHAAILEGVSRDQQDNIPDPWINT
jgi:hypothetical protein